MSVVRRPEEDDDLALRWKLYADFLENCLKGVLWSEHQLASTLAVVHSDLGIALGSNKQAFDASAIGRGDPFSNHLGISKGARELAADMVELIERKGT